MRGDKLYSLLHPDAPEVQAHKTRRLLTRFLASQRDLASGGSDGSAYGAHGGGLRWGGNNGVPVVDKDDIAVATFVKFAEDKSTLPSVEIVVGGEYYRTRGFLGYYIRLTSPFGEQRILEVAAQESTDGFHVDTITTGLVDMPDQDNGGEGLWYAEVMVRTGFGDGGWSEMQPFTVGSDTTPPDKPDAPTLAARKGTIDVSWPACTAQDYSHTYVYKGVGDFIKDDAVLVGTVTGTHLEVPWDNRLDDLTAGYDTFKIQHVDRSDNESALSDATTLGSLSDDTRIEGLHLQPVISYDGEWTIGTGGFFQTTDGFVKLTDSGLEIRYNPLSNDNNLNFYNASNGLVAQLRVANNDVLFGSADVGEAVRIGAATILRLFGPEINLIGPVMNEFGSEALPSLRTKARASQTGSLFQAENASGTPLFSVAVDGEVTVAGPATFTGHVEVDSLTATGGVEGDYGFFTSYLTTGGSVGAAIAAISGALSAASAAITGLVTAASGYFTADTASTVPLTAKGAASQSANLVEVRNSTGTLLYGVNAKGYVGMGTAPTNSSGLWSVGSFTDDSAAYYGATVRGTKSVSGSNALYGQEVVGITMHGAGTQASVTGNYQRTWHLGGGTVTDSYGGYATIFNTGFGTLTNVYGLYVATPVNSGGGSIGTAYGLFIANQNVGSTKYALWTDGGHVRLNSGATGVIPLTVNGASGQTANLQEWTVNGTVRASLDATGFLSLPKILLSGSPTFNIPWQSTDPGSPADGDVWFKRAGTGLWLAIRNSSTTILASLDSNGGRAATQTGAFTPTGDYKTWPCNGTFTVSLPAASGCTGRTHTLPNIGTGVITIDPNSTETVGGRSTWRLERDSSITIQSNGTNWDVLEGHNHNRGSVLPTTGLYAGLVYEYLIDGAATVVEYDGSVWLGPTIELSVQKAEAPLPPWSGTSDMLFMGMVSDRALKLERWGMTYLITSGNHSLAHYYDIRLYRNTSSDGYDVVATITTNKSTVGLWVKATDCTSFSNNPLNASDRFFKMRSEATGTPGPLHAIIRVRGREVYT